MKRLDDDQFYQILDHFKKDRAADKRGGGVMLALREGLDYSRITWGVCSDRVEIIAIEDESQREKKCLACICFRPPNCDLKE